jgi:hypothetical protein
MINAIKMYIYLFVNLLYFIQRCYIFEPPIVAIVRRVFGISFICNSRNHNYIVVQSDNSHYRSLL